MKATRTMTGNRPYLMALMLFTSSCAGHRAPVYVAIQRFVFVETLPPETELCVRSNPWVDNLSCITLQDFRDNVRGIKRADWVAP